MSDVTRLFLVAVGLSCAFYLVATGDPEAEDLALNEATARHQAQWIEWDNLTPAQKAMRLNPVIEYVLEVE